MADRGEAAGGPGGLLPTERRAALAPADVTPTRVFRELSKRTAPGLPQSTVMSMLQDESGLLWLATLDGLGTFDGTEVRRVDPQPHAPVQGAVYSLFPRRAGGFYAGAGHSIHVFDGEAWSEIPAPGMSFFLIEDIGGRLVRLDGQSVLRHSDDTGGWPPLRLEGLEGSEGPGGAADDTAEAILGAGVAARQDAEGGLWVAGRRGVASRRAGAWRLVAGGARVPSEISAMTVTRDGTCVIGTLEGSVFLAEPGDAVWTPVELRGWKGSWIRALEEDRRGQIWAGGNAGGVAFGRPGEVWTVWDGDNGMVRGGVLDILADREGSVWFSVNGRGAYQWVGESWSHRKVWGEDRLDPRLQVFGIRGTLDGRGFYAAVFGRGVWHWDGERLFEIPQDGFQDARVAIEPAPGVLWVGGRFGAWELRRGEPIRQVLSLDSGFVWDFELAGDGTWFAATSTAGVFAKEGEVWRPAEEINRQLPDLAVRDLMWRSGELWLGTMGGVAVMRDGRRLELPGAEALPPAINGLLSVEDAVWVVGAGGAAVWRDGEVERLGEAEGMPGNTVYSVAQDPRGVIWVGGSSGVARFEEGEWRRNRTRDGLIEDECNHQALWPAPDGSVYVGTMASLARWDGGLEPLERPDLEVFWVERPAERVPAGKRSVRLEWHSPWLLPQPVEYRVRVPRLDPEWSRAQDERFLELENLGPGHWRVEVAARLGGQGQWSEPISTDIYVEPRWWETSLFVLLSAIAALCLMGLVVRWRTRRLALRAQELEHSVDDAVAKLKVLRGLLPICSVCKKVRDDDGYWQQIERYIDEHSEAVFSHGLCPGCLDDRYPEWAQQLSAKTEKSP